MDLLVLEIERRWHQAPGWLLEQPAEKIAELIAWHRVTTDPSRDKPRQRTAEHPFASLRAGIDRHNRRVKRGG